MWHKEKEPEIQRISNILIKKQLKVFIEDNNTISVFWEDKGKVKFGFIDKHYWHRYGIKTQISLTIGSLNPWFSSNDFANNVDQQIVELLKSGDWMKLNDFSIDLLKSIRF